MSYRRFIHIDGDGVRTFFQGFLGALGFVAYNRLFVDKTMSELKGQVAEQRRQLEMSFLEKSSAKN